MKTYLLWTTVLSFVMLCRFLTLQLKCDSSPPTPNWSKTTMHFLKKWARAGTEFLNPATEKRIEEPVRSCPGMVHLECRLWRRQPDVFSAFPRDFRQESQRVPHFASSAEWAEAQGLCLLAGWGLGQEPVRLMREEGENHGAPLRLTQGAFSALRNVRSLWRTGWCLHPIILSWF